MLHLIWLVLLLMVVAFYGIRKRHRMVTAFVNLSLIPVMIPGYSSGRRWAKALILVTVLLLSVLSLAGPEVGFRWETVEQKGVDIMIALDCSRSMLATDIKPSRLEQAKREIIDLLNMMQSDRAGLVAFAGSAVLQCPLTLDHAAFHIFLQALSPDYLPRGGTDISGAIQTALNGFESDVDSEKAIILITDGENTSGDPEPVVKEAVKSGVRIFCIGVGSEEGAPVPDGNGGFKKDPAGRIIMSKVDDLALQKIAAMGTGRYVKSVAGDMDLDLIYTHEILEKMERTTIQSGRKKVWENRFQWLLFPAVLLFFLELMLSEKKPVHKKAPLSATRRLMPLIWVAPLLTLGGTIGVLPPSVAEAGTYSSVKEGIEAFDQGRFEDAKKRFIDAQLDQPDMPELYYNIGSAAYKTEAYDEALNNFTRAMDTEDPVLRDKSRFNLGNTKYQLGDLEGAIEAFEGIGEDSTLYKKAMDNIAFVKKVMEEQKRQKEQQSPEKDQQKQQGDQDNQEGQKDDQQNRQENQENQKDQQNQQGDRENQSDPQNQQSNQQKQGDQQNQQGDQAQQKRSNGQDQKRNDGKAPDDNQPQDQDQRQHGEQNRQDRETSSDEQQSDKGRTGDEKENEPMEQRGAQQETKTGVDENREQNHAYQRLLNRLEDKPGAAMVPVYSGKPVEKDW